MAKLEKVASIWHAFDALDIQQTGTVSKTKLKVLTHNIGNILGLENVEKSLEEFRSSDSISFLDYHYFLKVEFFTQLERKSKKDQEATNASSGRHAHKVRALTAVSKCDWDKIDEVCWFVCHRKFVELQKRVFDEDQVYKLWRVFNFVAETEGEEEARLIYPIVADKEETQIIAEKLVSVTQVPFDQATFIKNYENTQCFLFASFLEVMAQACTGDGTIKPDVAMLALAVGEVFDNYIVEVIKKGYMTKKGHVMTTWRERWFVVTPQCLRYYTSRDEKDLKGEVTLTSNCKVERLPDKSSTKPNRFQLVSEAKTFELSAPDMKSRTEWITALQHAINYSTNHQSPQRTATLRRRTVRDATRSKQEEEYRKAAEERMQMKLTQQQLLAEQEAHAKAKAQLEELEALTEAEKEERAKNEARLQEEARLEREEKQRLEELNQELERLLEAERQAIRDEEIVRSLQARVLAEEFEKREELERMQEEMQMRLQKEHLKRQDLEQWKAEQEKKLTEEQQKLLQLEQERKRVGQSLEDALRKLDDAEKDRVQLQEKLKKKKETSLTRFLERKVDPISLIPAPAFHRGPGAVEALLSPTASSASSCSFPLVKGIPKKEVEEKNNNDSTKMKESDVKDLGVEKIRITANNHDVENGKCGQGGGLVQNMAPEHSDGLKQEEAAAASGET